MIRKLLERIVPIVLICTLAGDLMLISAILIGKYRLRSARAEYGRAGGAAAPQIAAFDNGGAALDLAGQNAGLAVWYGSSRCAYCRKDEEWRRLAVALQERGVNVVVLLPSVADSFSNDELLLRNARQVRYLNGEWLRRYPLSVTPTLLLFDSNRRLIWHRYGMLGPKDVKTALSVIDEAISE